MQETKEMRIWSWVRKIPWSRNGNPLQYSCLGNFHGQRSLTGYSPRGCKELDVTEHACKAKYSLVPICPLSHLAALPPSSPPRSSHTELRSSTQPFDTRLLHILPSACHPLILSLKIYFPGRALLTSWTRIGHCCGPPHRNLSYSFPSTHYICKFPKGLIQPSTYLTIISRIPTMC